MAMVSGTEENPYKIKLSVDMSELDEALKKAEKARGAVGTGARTVNRRIAEFCNIIKRLSGRFFLPKTEEICVI